MGGAQAQVVANPLGVQEAELEADKGAPVVADQMDPAEFECLQQCHDVGEQLVARVSSRRGVGPTRPPQVGADHAVVLGQP